MPARDSHEPGDASGCRSRAALAVLAGAAFALSSSSSYGAPDYTGTRSLGAGGALRGAATGASGPLLNPSGMSLLRAYNIEAAYGMTTPDTAHALHASIVDSTSGVNLAGGVYYTYRAASPAGLPKFDGHEGGLALSYPFGAHLALGATAKYFYLSGGTTGIAGEGDGGFSVDAGTTIRMGPVTLAAVGYNLRDLKTRQAPLALGYGIAFSPSTELVLAVDGVTDFTTYDDARGARTTVRGGGEVFLARRWVIRAGGGRDGLSENGYFSLGFAAVSEVGAIDVGARQDAFMGGTTQRQTFVGVSLRLFVPQP